MIGFASINFDIYTSSNYFNCGWYLYCNELTLYSGPPYNYNGKKTNLSSIKYEIKIVMNMNKRTLKFLINNEDKGKSYIDIPIDIPITPAVLLYDDGEFVEIIKC